MSKEKARDRRIDTDEDFVVSPKHGNSLKRLMDDYPDGAPDNVICKALDMTPAELQTTFERAIVKLRSSMNVSQDNDEI